MNRSRVPTFEGSYLSSFGEDARREITKSLGDRLEEQNADTGYRLHRLNENAVREFEPKRSTLRLNLLPFIQLSIELDYTFRTKIPIKWEFSLQTVSSLVGSSQDPNSTFADRLFHSHVVAPLVILGEEYKRRMEKLEDGMRYKDREISDLLEAIAENRTEGVKSGTSSRNRFGVLADLDNERINRKNGVFHQGQVSQHGGKSRRLGMRHRRRFLFLNPVSTLPSNPGISGIIQRY